MKPIWSETNCHMKDAYKIAQKLVSRKKAFFKELQNFLIILAIGVWVLYFSHFSMLYAFRFWFFLIMIISAINLVFRYVYLFIAPEWEEQLIQKELEQLRRKKDTDKSEEEPLELRALQKASNTRKEWDDSELV